jgi:hypothetical protein
MAFRSSARPLAAEGGRLFVWGPRGLDYFAFLKRRREGGLCWMLSGGFRISRRGLKTRAVRVKSRCNVRLLGGMDAGRGESGSGVWVPGCGMNAWMTVESGLLCRGC